VVHSIEVAAAACGVSLHKTNDLDLPSFYAWRHRVVHLVAQAIDEAWRDALFAQIEAPAATADAFGADPESEWARVNAEEEAHLVAGVQEIIKDKVREQMPARKPKGKKRKPAAKKKAPPAPVVDSQPPGD